VGGGGSGGFPPLVASIFQGQGIGWLISVLTVYSILIVTAGLIVARRRRR
jgi:hypothetical protein